MADVLEMLRRYDQLTLQHQAANEIEALRAEVESYGREAEVWYAKLQAADAEVERLNKMLGTALHENVDAHETIERLWWLVREGERHFGTLWRDATWGDIDAARLSSPTPAALPNGET